MFVVGCVWIVIDPSVSERVIVMLLHGVSHVVVYVIEVYGCNEEGGADGGSDEGDCEVVLCVIPLCVWVMIMFRD